MKTENRVHRHEKHNAPINIMPAGGGGRGGAELGHGVGIWLSLSALGVGHIWIFLRLTWRYLTADSDKKDWDRKYVSCFHASRMRRTVWKDLEIMEANGNKQKLSGFHCFVFKFSLFSRVFDQLNLLRYYGIKVNGSKEKQSRFLQVQLISVWLIRYNHCIKHVKLTFLVPLIYFLLKGYCLLCSVTRIMVKTYNCSCNRNMYIW